MSNRHLYALVALFLASTTQALEIQEWQTQNGAKVMFMETHDLKMLDIRVVFNAGSAQDGEKFGVAQMTNQLMSAGTESQNEEEIALTFENQGAIFSHQSLRDMSLFSIRSLSNGDNLAPVLNTFTDILRRPSFPEQIFNREQQRNLQSLKAEKQSADTLASQAFMRALYKDHPYAHPSQGTKESISALTPSDLKAFHQKHMVGKNTTIAMVGDLTLLQAKTLANQIVGKLPAGQKPTATPAVAPLSTAVEDKIAFPSSQTHILIGQPGLTRNDPDYFPLYVGNHILGGSGLVSRISDEIREKRGLAYSAYSYFSPMRAKGPFQIGTQTKTKTTDEALKVLQDTLSLFVSKGPSEKELTQSKQNITGGFALRLDSNKKIVEYLSLIGFYNLPLNYLDTFKDKVNEVTIEDIQKTWQKRIHPEKMAVILLGNLK